MYITPNDLIYSFSERTLMQLSQDEPTARDVNTAVLEQAIKVASERIDAALRGRYVLPLTDVPTVLTSYALFLARYWLYSRRPETKMPDNVKDTYLQTIKELDQIATGKLHLGISGQSEISQGSANTTAALGDLLLDSGEFRVKAAKRLNTGGY